jgi:hypothetical protein
MPTITISLDDGTQVYSIGFSDADWPNMTSAVINSHHNTILADPGSPAVAPIYDVDGVTIITPGIDAVPPTYRDPNQNEALAMKFDEFFSRLISDAVMSLRDQVVAPIPDSITTAATTTTITTRSPPIFEPPIKVGPAQQVVG